MQNIVPNIRRLLLDGWNEDIDALQNTSNSPGTNHRKLPDWGNLAYQTFCNGGAGSNFYHLINREPLG